ncbi:MAG: hypothetical protein HY725_14275 [Candidatus Rokubacteria bacterium]|nr:hypothetical protein [Candidatus Rokubacteria bacterium]
MLTRILHLLLVPVLLGLMGCSSAVTLRHPVSGQTVTCGPSWGQKFAGALAVGLAGFRNPRDGGAFQRQVMDQDFRAQELESIRQQQCIGDAQRQGYIPVTDASEPRPTPTTIALAPSTGLNGTFTGEITGNARGREFSMKVTFTLVQSGDQVAGAWNTTGGTSGTVTGTIREGNISDFQARQVNPCEGKLAGMAVIENNNIRLRGSYTGSDCSGSVTASFVVNRQ